MDTLRSWLEREGRKQKWLAGQLGVSRQVVTRWVGGATQPTLQQAYAIERVTGGEVPPTSWLTSDAE